MKTLQILQSFKDIVDIAIANGLSKNDIIIQPAIKTLKESMLPTAEFSSMAIDLMSGWPHLQ